jgi:hypothetical protein
MEGILVLMAAVAVAAGEIRLPQTEPQLPEPVSPAVVSQNVSEIRADELYVVESDNPLICLTVPEGVVSVSAESGPMRIRAKLAGGTGKVSTRTFAGPHVYLFEPVGTGSAELILIPSGVELAEQVVRQSVTVGGSGPRPPPVEPVVPVPPATSKIKVLVIEESDDRGGLPLAQFSALTGKAFRDYCKAHCSMTGSSLDIRILDQDNITGASQQWITEAAGKPRSALPWIVILGENGREASQPFPDNEEQLLALLKEYGG